MATTENEGMSATPEEEQGKKDNAKIEQLEKEVARLKKDLEQAKTLASQSSQKEPLESDFDRIFRKEIK